jgi:hypothetical protein
VHNVLSKIIYSADAEKTFRQFSDNGIISKEQSEEIKIIIESVLKICEPHKWFSQEWKIKTEAPLLLPDGAVIRPDRVMIKEKNAVILDYKTGEEDEMHERQLNIYGQNLIASGYESVEKYLLYLKPIKLLKL